MMKFNISKYGFKISSRLRKHAFKFKNTVNIFNFKIIILLLAIFFLFILPININIPNFLEISESRASDLLIVIVGSLASILGVLVAVIIVAFNILRKSYNVYAFRTFFKDKKLSEFITFYLLTITIAYLTLICITNPLKPQIINLIYFSIFLFIISLWILFPYSNIIISSTQSKENIKKIVNKININVAQVYNFGEEVMPSFSIVNIEENPIFVLNELGTRTLKDNDWLTSIYILQESEEKLFYLLDDHLKKNGTTNQKTNQERRNIINLFLLIVKPITYQAIKMQDEGVLRDVLGFVERLHYFCSQNRMSWYEVIELNYFIQKLLKETLTANLDNITYMGIIMAKRIMKTHLKYNVPIEDEIDKLYYWKYDEDTSEINVQNSNHWEEVNTEYVKIISETSKKAIELGNGEIVDKGISNLLNLVIEVLELPLGNFQKYDVIRNCCWNINDIIRVNANAKIDGDNFYLSNFHIGIKSAIKSTEAILKTLLFSYADTLITLAKNGVLNFFELNELGAISRGFARKINENELYKKSIIFNINLFDKLREVFEDEIDDNQTNYIEIYKQVISIRDWIKRENGGDNEIDDVIENVLSNFNDYKKIKEKLENENITIEWP